MNKLILPVVIAVISTLPLSSLYAQEKKETEDWIKQVVENYAYNSHEVTNRYTVTFQDFQTLNCYMTINGYNSIEDLSVNVNYRYDIDPSELSGVQFEERDQNVQMIFKIKPGTDGYIFVRWPDYSERKDQVSLLMSAPLKQNNMIQRLTDAFNHYIKLCGGEPLDDTF